MSISSILLSLDREVPRSGPFDGTPSAELATCPDFATRLERLTAKYCALWWHSPTRLPDFGDPIPRWRQRRNRRQVDRFTDELEAELTEAPLANASSGPDQRRWRDRLHAKLRDLGDRLLPLGAAERQVIFSDEYFEATLRFVREARAFDPDLELVDLSQALRNVWIMHLFQLLLGRRVAYTTPILAYSLLYPYTDNRLDDPALSAQAKRAFCRRLEQRLEGIDVPLPEDDGEAAVFRLIDKIEAALPRARHPGVYQSLLAIHRAQTRSLAQQDQTLCEAELLWLSVAKGGSSVLADGYLVAGDLSPEEMDFFFGYGVFLQLADDLQDAEQDHGCDHATLFSSRARRRSLDRLANRLVHFLDSILASPFASSRDAVLKSLIRQSCVQLIVESAGSQPRCFSRRYLRILGRHSMTGFSYLRKQRGGLVERARKIERLPGVLSQFDEAWPFRQASPRSLGTETAG